MVRELTCEEFHDVAPELALGILDAEDRAAAIGHASHCQGCQHELAALGDVADDVVALTPAVEPPPGFETRVLGTLSSKHRRPRVPRLLQLAAAAVVAAAVSIAGWTVASGSGHPAELYARGPVTAPLKAADHQMGQVMVARDPSHPWLSMAVSNGPGDELVTCRVHEQNGQVVTVGWFRLNGGRGYWAAALPHTTSPVTGALLVGANGATIATADLSGGAR